MMQDRPPEGAKALSNGIHATSLGKAAAGPADQGGVPSWHASTAFPAVTAMPLASFTTHASMPRHTKT